MDVLFQEIEKKRKAQLELKKSGGKYIKRGDVELMRRQEYDSQQQSLEQEREEARHQAWMAAEAAKKARAEGKASSRAHESRDLKASDQEASGDQEAETLDQESKEQSLEQLDAEDVIKRLRLRGQPIQLFGETDTERHARLKECEIKEVRDKGLNNTLKTMLLDGERTNTEGLLGAQEKEKVDVDAHVDTTQLSLELLKENQNLTCILITIYLKRTVREWELHLAARPEAVKRTADGKLKTSLHAQTLLFLKPLYKRLKNHSLPLDVLEKLVLIIKNLHDREYQLAQHTVLLSNLVYESIDWECSMAHWCHCVEFKGR